MFIYPANYGLMSTDLDLNSPSICDVFAAPHSRDPHPNHVSRTFSSCPRIEIVDGLRNLTISTEVPSEKADEATSIAEGYS